MYKHIPLKGKIIDYPVGINISKNLASIKEMAKKIKQEYPKQTLIFWVRGSSWAIIASMIAGFLKRQECIINYTRKPGEESHAGTSYIDNSKGIQIIIDDFIATGSTLDNIFTEMSTYGQSLDCICVSGIVWLNRINNIISNSKKDLVLICENVRED